MFRDPIGTIDKLKEQPAMKRGRGILVAAWMALHLFTAGAAEKSSIAIEKATRVRLEQRFKLGEQPEHLTYQLKDEAGLCDYRFGLLIQIETEYPRLAVKNVTATVRGIKMRLTLDTTLWVSKEGGAKVQAHEEAHRAICEAFYRDADVVARSLAEKVIGQKLTVANKDRENAFKDAL